MSAGLRPATDIPLRDFRAATTALNEQRKRLGLQVWEVEEASGVSISTFFAWKSGSRVPTLLCMVALAETLGFEMLMLDGDDEEFPVASAKDAMRIINDARRLLQQSMDDVAAISGVNAGTMFQLSAVRRDARMSSMVAMGFELVLRTA